jgi:hypothetical protein
MPALESDLRRQLENVIIQARDVAEGAARSALQKRAVDVAEPFSHFGPKEKELRNRLRARGRQAGDVRNADKKQSLDQLTQELAYEFWHRMLFSRFLAENHLLMHPDGVAVSLEECEELAKDANPPASNGFVLAARYASTMLPQIFRTDDVLLDIDFAPEQRLALERLLACLPQKTFLADDSLGWVYQFWQSKKKDEVNKSGDKIDGRTLPAVTQLFTEHYMVQFLLHNTIGAWWCGRHGIQGPPGGAGVPAGKSPVEMEYLRWRDDGTPAAGAFDGWPKALTEFTMLDPCCGSGHFLVSAFNLLVPLRMHDEKLSAKKACEAVLRDNIYGLELDPRCTQIAAFALALAAWKYPDAGGYRPLPTLNLACSGQGVTEKKEDWLALANGDEKLRNGMERLYELFQQAPHLGSLVDPRLEGQSLLEAGFNELRAMVEQALLREQKGNDVEAQAVGVAAQGLAASASLLVRQYTLVATNVPYLGDEKQDGIQREYIKSWYVEGKNDLATAFVLRCNAFSAANCTAAIVTTQYWLFLRSYKKLREKLLRERQWNLLVRLGAGAFETISGEVVNAALLVTTRKAVTRHDNIYALDVVQTQQPARKALALQDEALICLNQVSQQQNPDHKIITEKLVAAKPLSDYADVYEGLHTGDYPRFGRNFWELPTVSNGWEFQHASTDIEALYGGREHILFWEKGRGQLIAFIQERLDSEVVSMWVKGEEAWGKNGVAVSAMSLRPTLYTGELFTHGSFVIIPKKKSDLNALWRFCCSDDFSNAVRALDHKVCVARSTFDQVPFEAERWRTIAKDNGELPPPHSADPTQWIFSGDIPTGEISLQVAVARLLGYRWPEQSKVKDAIDKLADSDGILCLPGVRGKSTAAERLLEVLQAAYGKNWSDSVLHKLLTDAGCKAGTTLDDWLRNQFFEQHCKRFDNRPFIWHIWDGRKDGFAALVNYHKFDYKALENLTYAYLGDWITAQRKSDKAGAESRFGDAQELQETLKLILAGEPPYDIFARWRPLHEQAIGWHPDLNDGVRINIRPFIEAEILRKTPNIKWTKDRGKEPGRDKIDYPWFWSGREYVGDRMNDIHLKNSDKQAARTRRKGVK